MKKLKPEMKKVKTVKKVSKYIVDTKKEKRVKQGLIGNLDKLKIKIYKKGKGLGVK